MIGTLKDFLKNQNIDYLLLPNSDEFFLEYLPANKKKVEGLTGFTGSNAFVIFGRKKSYFFTDGRYLQQAQNELDIKEFEILDLTKQHPLLFLQEILDTNNIVGLDPKLFNISNVEKLQKVTKRFGAKLRFLEEKDGFDDLLKEKLQNTTSGQVYNLDKKLVGVDSLTKRKAIANEIDGDFMLISKPENICWLLNLRGRDLENTPLILAYGLLFKDGSFDLFLDEKKISNSNDENLVNVNVVQESCIDLRLAILSKQYRKIQIDESCCNYFMYELLKKEGFEIIPKNDSIELAKAIKSDAEVKAIKKTHEIDGLALTKFLFWLDRQVVSKKKVDEISAANKLRSLRQENEGFVCESFPAISGFGSNGSIIHYHPKKNSNKKIDDSSLYLIDSGGQYLAKDFLGTTDITRTIAFGKETQEQIENFTRVLKGHIALARVKFKKGTTGCNLDILARFHLMQVCQDYAHGTGHGVGCFLSVHEGPCSISKRSHQQLMPNMILSNEPGFYADGQYGIRIENLLCVEEIDDEFLCFETISLAPIDPKLIDFKMMTYPEKKWLKEYHEKVLKVLGGNLSNDERGWLEEIVETFSS